jgi:hypothetical protein
MPAQDIYHEAVKNALIKDVWMITADPYLIRYKDVDLFADLAAEKPIAAERQGQKIVVEVKSFLSQSPMRDFEMALGQYIVYRNLIQLTAPEYSLYLAIKESSYQNFFLRDSIQDLTRINSIKLLVINTMQEEVLLWID